ncbi:uncharacterized protein LOC135378011 [Ornithodoros turicata]|uniref:uncharacterized protein LOC135378011 n=1 Tax=Ornithodoros turicata TaxID=34597 RepID=UPI00313A0733
MCLPKEKVLLCSKATNSNLRKHLKAQHPTELDKFERLLKKRKSVQPRMEDSGKQQKLMFAAPTVCQRRVDDMVVTFVVDTMQPFCVVEAPSFVNLVKTLAPNSNVLTRKMLVSRINSAFDAMQDELRSKLASVPYVTVTADCWTTFRRAYLAATVSWLDPESLSRTTAVLTCRRMEGRISYDRIADVLIESFDNFGLHGKVTKVVTDNGSNFVKAFRVLGQTELAADGHMEDNDATTDSIDLTTILNGASHGDVRVPLPPHHRCSAHTLNLVATVDASKAESCEMFSRPLCSVLRTCRQLWNRQGQSATAAETVQRFCGRALQRPVATRWNSLFDALTCLMELDNAGKDLDGLCRTLQIPPFKRPRDVLFIKEYCDEASGVCH